MKWILIHLPGIRINKMIPITILFWALIPIQANAIKQNVRFEHISINNGLPHSIVTSIFQDRIGFMWFGTLDGLCKFDGYQFKTMKYEPDNPNSISDNTITDIVEDMNGYIWIATQSGGLNRFDREHNRFMHFRHDPGNSNTISNDWVFALDQDADGNLWIGTESGLDYMQLDILKFEHFIHRSDDPKSLSYRSAGTILVDSENTLWVGSNNYSLLKGDLDKFIPEKNVFERCNLKATNPEDASDGMIQALFEDKNKMLWIGTSGNGVYSRNPITGEYKHYFKKYGCASPSFFDELETQIKSKKLLVDINKVKNFCHVTKNFKLHHTQKIDIVAIGEGFNGMMFDYGWIEAKTTGNIIWCMDLHETFTAGGHYKNRIQITTLPLEKGEYIVHYQTDGTHAYNEWNTRPPHAVDLYGIQIWSSDSNASSNLKNKLNELPTQSMNQLGSDFVTSITQDQEGFLWFGTQQVFGVGGLCRFDPETEHFENFVHDKYYSDSLSNNSILNLYTDLSGNLWISVFRKGLNKYNKSQARFIHHRHHPEDPNSLSSNFVSCFLEDSHHNIWIGTQKGGLQKFNRDKGTFERCGKLESIVDMVEGSDGWFWVLSPGPGLVFFDPQTYQVRVDNRYTSPGTPGAISSVYVTDIVKDNQNKIFIGTANGLNQYHDDTKRFSRIDLSPENEMEALYPYICSIYVDPLDDYLWICTQNKGLIHYHPNQQRSVSYQFDPTRAGNLSHNHVVSVCRGPENNLWVATNGGGLNKMISPNYFLNLTEIDGLSNNIVFSILPDEFGHLWISTNQGISRLNIKHETFLNFDVQDGLQDKEFLGNSALKTSDGELFFGGINGFNHFYPENIEKNHLPPPLVVTECCVMNETVLTDVIDEGILNLKYWQDYISFQFSALDYINPDKNHYAYRLTGFDEEWIDAGNRHFISYTNLPGGQYTFEIKGSNSDGVWNHNGPSIHINIRQPPWKTIWAYIAYFFSTCMLIIALIHLRVRKERQKSYLREVELKTKAAEAQARSIEIDNHRKTEELERARNLQLAMLPRRVNLVPYLDIAVFMKTATEVGGDYYDFFVQPDGSLFVVTGDATGHGLSAGMLVSMTKACLHALDVDTSNKLLKRLNHGIKRTNLEKMKMALNILHIDENHIEYSSAGMPPIYIFRKKNQSVEEIILSGLPLGSMENYDYALKQIDLNRGDTVVLISDGLPECLNRHDIYLGYDAIKNTIETCGQEDVQSIVNKLVSLCDMWADNKSHSDDITIMVLRRKESIQE